MRHVSLPDESPRITIPRDETSVTTARRPPNPADQYHENYTTVLLKEGQYVYMVKVAANGSNVAAWCMLTHPENFSQERLKQMCDEVANLINTVRIPKRIEETAAKKIPIENPPKLNEELFETDANFFESAMMDKFGFKKMLYQATDTSIDLTIKGVG